MNIAAQVACASEN